MLRIHLQSGTGLLLMILVIWTGICGCNVTKHLDSGKGERLLVKNSLKVTGDHRIGLAEKLALSYETGGLFKQQPNTVWIGFRTKLAAYYLFKNKTGKFANSINKKFAEPPAIYSDALAERTADNFQNYMRKKGYFDAVCTFKTTNKGEKKAKTVYSLELGTIYTLKSTTYACRDSQVLAILKDIEPDSYIKPGSPANGSSFDNERVRITTELRNRGYAAFIPGYIEYNGDSTGHDIKVVVDVLTPTDSTNHQRYVYGQVNVFSSLVPAVNVLRQEKSLNGINYFSNEPQFYIKPKYLDRIIKTRPDSLYSSAMTDRTNRNLSTLNSFKYISVRPRPDTLDKGVMNVDISYAPTERFSYGIQPDLNYTASDLTGDLIGVSANAFYQQRNLFHGAEVFSASLSGNVEFDPQKTSGAFLFSQEFKAQTDLSIPRFFDYFLLWKAFHKIHAGNFRLVNDKMYNKIVQEGRAHFGLNYNRLNLNGFYSYDLFNASFGYTLNPGGIHSYSFNHVGIDLLRPQLKDAFIKLAENNKLFFLRFTDQLFTGFILRSFNYAMYTKPNRFGERWGFQFNSDISGLEVHVLNNIFDKNKEWKLNGLPFARFARLEATGTYSRSFTKDVLAGLSFSSGIVAPFDRTNPTPYVKQFFMGGPSSVRAWNIRELGPGSYFDAANASLKRYYQASDFKLEFLSEVRFPLFWWFKGAVFLDGGNIFEIWQFSKEDPRPGAQLNWKSYQNIAIGTGAGIRFDFGYSIIRFDWGIKLRRPYRNPGTGSYWVHWNVENGKITNWKEISNFNLAVGYPF